MYSTLKHLLRWSRRRKAQLAKAMHSGTRWMAGTSCIFIPLGKHFGAKLYYHMDERNFALQAQQLAYKHNLGPMSGSKFRISHLNLRDGAYEASTELLYGYLTERATVRTHVSSRRMKELRVRLMEIGLSGGDIQDFNVGYINNMLVCIDFDKNSHSRG